MTTIIFRARPFEASADTQTSAGSHSHNMPIHDSKIFTPLRSPNLLIGFSGAVSDLTLMQTLEVPALNEPSLTSREAQQFSYHAVLPAIRSLFQEKLHQNNMDSQILYALFPSATAPSDPHIFTVHHDFALTALPHGQNFLSTGSGSMHALAHASFHPKAPTYKHVLHAAKNDLFTSAPIHTFTSLIEDPTVTLPKHKL